MAHYEEVSYGVDLFLLDHWLYENQTLAGDLNLHRTTELEVEKLLKLRRKMQWRIARYGDVIFTAREIEVMKCELALMRPPFQPTQEAIAKRLHVTQPTINKLLRSAELLMYYFQLVTREHEFVGWENTGSREHPHWRLCAPTTVQAQRVVKILDFQLATAEPARRKAA